MKQSAILTFAYLRWHAALYPYPAPFAAGEEVHVIPHSETECEGDMTVRVVDPLDVTRYADVPPSALLEVS